MTKPICISHVTTSISRLAGGLFESVRHLAQETRKNGAQIEIMGLQDESSTVDMPSWSPLHVRVFPISGPKQFGYSPALSSALTSTASDLVHLHGLWQYPSLAVANWGRTTGKPYIVSPRGMLEPWALKQSRWRKKIAGVLYQNRCLENAACLHATSAMELESVRRAGFRNPIALIPNGVSLNSTTSEIRSPTPAFRTALFLSRIHPKKGLLNLVKAWSQVQKTRDSQQPWRLVIAGPDQYGHLSEVKAAVQKYGIENEVIFHNEVLGDARTELYRSADLFVLPSFSENFGLVIAEALSFGMPVITTRATPWEELETNRCGWWIDVGVEPLMKALQEAMNCSPETLHETGQCGRKLIEAKYAWEPIAKQMAEVYEWVAGKNRKPECISTI